MEFNIGDFVFLKQDSVFYTGEEDGSNPIHVVGIVKKINRAELPIHVSWVNGEKNTYKGIDLYLADIEDHEKETYRMIYGL